MKFKKIYWLIHFMLTCTILIFLCTGCWHSSGDSLKEELDSIGAFWIQDKREGVYDITLISNGGKSILKGETDSREAREDVVEFLKNKGIIFADSLLLLPDSALVKDHWGLVNVSVCNIRLSPSYSAEMTSQALMGTPVRILKKEAGWFMIQTPDTYIGWVDNDIIVTKSNNEYSDWKSSARIFYAGKTGDIYSEPDRKKIISDVVAGCILETGGRRMKTILLSYQTADEV